MKEKSLTESVDAYLGKGEYARPDNILYADGFYLKFLYEKFGKKQVDEKIEERKAER